MNYDEMSDFEISHRIAEILGLYWMMNPSHQLNDSGSWIYGEEPKDKAVIAVKLPDYCNDPSAAWPVIVGNDIALTPIYSCRPDTGTHELNGRWRASTGEFSEYFEYESSKPLRAAMIVFLKMKEAEL